MHRWWHTKQLADNRIIMGKPSVLFRKVVNTRVGDEIIAVNAQQYAVLVMDVPNLHKENDRCAASALSDPDRLHAPSSLHALPELQHHDDDSPCSCIICNIFIVGCRCSDR